MGIGPLIGPMGPADEIVKIENRNNRKNRKNRKRRKSESFRAITLKHNISLSTIVRLASQEWEQCENVNIMVPAKNSKNINGTGEGGFSTGIYGTNIDAQAMREYMYYNKYN